MENWEREKQGTSCKSGAGGDSCWLFSSLKSGKQPTETICQSDIKNHAVLWDDITMEENDIKRCFIILNYLSSSQWVWETVSNCLQRAEEFIHTPTSGTLLPTRCWGQWSPDRPLSLAAPGSFPALGTRNLDRLGSLAKGVWNSKGVADYLTIMKWAHKSYTLLDLELKT